MFREPLLRKNIEVRVSDRFTLQRRENHFCVLIRAKYSYVVFSLVSQQATGVGVAGRPLSRPWSRSAWSGSTADVDASVFAPILHPSCSTGRRANGCLF